MNSPLTGILTLSAVQESIPLIIAAVNDRLEQVCCPTDTRRQIDIAIDEVASNIVNYAYPETGGILRVRYDIAPGNAVLCFCDTGAPFNPLENEKPDLNVISDKGGLGIFITLSIMDNVSYARQDGENALTLQKRWN